VEEGRVKKLMTVIFASEIKKKYEKYKLSRKPSSKHFHRENVSLQYKNIYSQQFSGWISFYFFSHKTTSETFLADIQHHWSKVILRLRNSRSFLLNPPPSGSISGQHSNQTNFRLRCCSSVSLSPAQGPIANEGDQDPTTLDLKACAEVCGRVNLVLIPV